MKQHKLMKAEKQFLEEKTKQFKLPKNTKQFIKELTKKPPLFRRIYLNIKWPFEDLLNIPHRLYFPIKRFVQRGRQGIGDSDVWNLDDYVIMIIGHGCARLKKNHIGCPSIMTEKQWNKILGEIIKGCKSWERRWDCSLKQADKNKIKTNRAMQLFAKYYEYLWD